MKRSILLKFIVFAFPLILIIFAGNFLDKNFNEKADFEDIDNQKYCNKLSYEKNLNLHPSKFSSNIILHIKFESERSWKTNLLNNLIKSEKNKKDSENWRNFSSKSKRQPGFVFIEIPDVLKCKINARIRDHGDLLDQRDGTLLPSLNIHLTNGHIFGITKFILFLPHARNGANEIFATELFRSTGILSPKSMFINVKYGKNTKKFIFQEKIQKELLESNNLREAPILEGDERFAFWDDRHKQNLSKNKIVNVNWAKKSNSTFQISEYSISLLNHLVQIHDTENILTDNLDYHTIDEIFLNKKLFVDLDVFDAFSIAMGSDHTMPRNERRFYFDPLFKKFYPIYYDGMYRIVENENPFVNSKDEMIIPSAKKGAVKAVKLIDEMDIHKFHKNINAYGYDISFMETKEKLNNIKKDLIEIQKFDDKRLFNIKVNDKRNPFVEQNEDYDQKLKRKLVFYYDNFTEYLKCDIFGESCEKVNFSDKEKYKLINQELIDDDGNNLIYVGKKKYGSPKENWIYSKYFLDNNISEINQNTKILTFGSPEIIVNKDQKYINIKKISQIDRVVFFGGSLKNWKIQMEDLTDFKKLRIFGSEINNLTGCLNFYDMEVQNLDLFFKNSNCEDAINFVRVKGEIKNMTIKNSAFDGMDADFSNIQFNNVNINNSLNDCLDFSYGKYKIKNAFIKFCGDKAISAGEISIVSADKVNISNSNSGIASKDFATVNISNSEIIDTEYCFQAYNKKSEFSGGFINSKNIVCKFNKKFATTDQSSKILLDGENFTQSMWDNKIAGTRVYNGI